MSGIWLFLRLAFALAVVLAPGVAIARAFGVRGASAAVGFGLLAIGGALLVTFVVSGSLGFTLVVLLLIGAAAAPAAVRRRAGGPLHGSGAVVAGGALLGILLWHVAGEVGGDGFFHLARVEKLLRLGDLSPARVVEFPDGGLHPGYAFPLWHAFLGLVAKVSGATPEEVVVHLPSVLTPLCALVLYESARALFGKSVPALGATAAGITLVGLAPGHGGALTALALPATAARQLLVPLVLALAFMAVRRPAPAQLAAVAAGSLVLAAVHASYAIFVVLPFVGFVAARWLWTRLELRAGIATLVALTAPTVLFGLLLLPVANDTVSVSPDTDEIARALRHYAGQLRIHSPTSYSVAPDLFGRAGAVAVAALLVIPLAGLAARRRWAAYVIGASLTVFLITLLPFLFVPFSDVVSLSQSRRFAGFVPFAFALAGGLGVAAARLGRASLPLALAAGVLLQVTTPGDFGYSLEDGGPSAVTWLAVVGAIAALVYGAVRHAPPVEAIAGLTTALFLLPVVVHGFSQWTPSAARPASPLSDGLLAAIRKDVEPGATVYSSPEASYRLAAVAPVYVCVVSPGHVADTRKNRPRERVAAFRRFLATADVAIARRCGAQWLILDKRRFPRLETRLSELPVAFRDERWTLYRL
ncbi:MAG: hypothetical protein U0R50_14715 [Gaiellales bacterium]